MIDLAEYVDGLPNISGSEERIRQVIQASRTTPVFLPQGASGFGEINSAFAIALHMHQPLIPAGGPELRTAPMLSNWLCCKKYEENAEDMKSHVPIQLRLPLQTDWR